MFYHLKKSFKYLAIFAFFYLPASTAFGFSIRIKTYMLTYAVNFQNTPHLEDSFIRLTAYGYNKINGQRTSTLTLDLKPYQQWGGG
ncbi:MAG: hypothetical protein K2X39_08185 [Silvanigrellaceae bacterium]|nr:hypothetical protein [Silvanigrellaceae bacterium]